MTCRASLSRHNHCVRMGQVAWRSSPLAAWALSMGFAAAQVPAVGGNSDNPAPVFQLKPSGLLQDSLGKDANRASPSFVTGDQMEGKANLFTEVQGNAELRRHDTVIRANKLRLDHPTNEAHATGNVVVIRNGNRYEGPELRLNLDTYVGFFSKPSYVLLQNDAQGGADRLDFQGENLSVVTNATYSTCKAPPGFLPDWWVSASRLELDSQEEVGRATAGAVYFKGVPLLATPYISFPISDKRKSGLLPPTINLDNISGLELTLPYYWNIAPQFDATLYPTLMTKRGVDLGGEFRYLQPSFNGQVRATHMSSDKLTGTNRWGTSIQHQHALDGGAVGLAGTGIRINLNRVSDDTYWRDFPRSSPSLTQRLLPNDVVISGNLGAVGLTAGVYRWQTLQDSAAPIVAPYDRTPQVDARMGRLNQTMGGVDGIDWSLSGQFSHFTSNRAQTVTATQADINGSRVLGLMQASKTWQTPGWFVRPKAQLQLRQYQFDQSLWTGARSAAVAVPTFSLDSGLIYERNTSVLGHQVQQTLEPRAMYVVTPYRNQNGLPNYDSGAKDFNVGTAWTENVFGGSDRISDTHALTLGVSSRLIEPDTGAEAARFGIAQRLRFANQNVVLPGGTALTDRVSDILLGTTLNWSPQWAFESSVQFNPKTSRSQRTTLSGRYHPTPYRVFSAAYRLQRAGGLLPASEQIDVGWQWPLDDVFGGSMHRDGTNLHDQGLGSNRWYSVGRVNYSMPDSKVVDLVAGFEYDAGCWLGRMVLERLQRSNATAGQRILLQLEFVGFTRIGSNPLQTLKNNVPRYQYLREQVQPPSRFGRYE